MLINQLSLYRRKIRFMMKTVLVILFVLGLVLLHLQVDARRLALEDVTKEKIDNQIMSDAHPGHKLDVSNAANDIKPTYQPGKSSIYGSLVTEAGPTPDANEDNTSNKSSGTDDDTNINYGNYGNPSGSSTETHHVYTADCQPKKIC